MSSIYGLCKLDRSPAEQKVLKDMEAVLDHWEPDARGTWMQKNVAMGHLMLWNTPESKIEPLPFSHHESQLTITADARIDNRTDIIRILNIEATKSDIPDSQLILGLYKKLGTRCLEHLIGDFSFAIWDGNQQQLFCARDHLGVKPFFYYQDAIRFIFASELNGILCNDQIDASVDMDFIYRQMLFQPFHYPDATMYKKAKRLPPAHYLLLNAGMGAATIQRYWEPDVHTELRLQDPRAYQEGIRTLFEEAVQCRLRTAYPVGAELSGGIDSSAIVGMANKLLKGRNQLTTFSHVLPENVTSLELRKIEEREYIEAVLRFNNITQAEYITSTGFNSYTDEIDFSLQLNGGLDAKLLTGLSALKEVAREKGIRTVLSGFAGDEVVTFRGKKFPLHYLDKGQYLRFLTEHTGIGRSAKLELLTPHKVAYLMQQIKNRLGYYDRDLSYATAVFNIPSTFRPKLYDPFWKDPFIRQRYKSYRHFHVSGLMSSHVSFRMESETRAGMYFRNEPRYPMADIRLIQFCISMPNELKYGGPVKRYTFINSVRDLLPDTVIKRNSKAGNVSPFRKLRATENFLEAIETYKRIGNHPFINQKLKLQALDKQKALKPGDFENLFMYKMDVLRWIEKICTD